MHNMRSYMYFTGIKYPYHEKKKNNKKNPRHIIFIWKHHLGSSAPFHSSFKGKILYKPLENSLTLGPYTQVMLHSIWPDKAGKSLQTGKFQLTHTHTYINHIPKLIKGR